MIYSVTIVQLYLEVLISCLFTTLNPPFSASSLTMSYPTTYSAFRRTTGDLPNTIEPSKETLPKVLGKHDVLIKTRAVSLNYRDVGILIGNYPAPTKQGGIPTSDAAGEVISVGSDVSGFAAGDRVAPITGVGKYEGPDDVDAAPLGTAADGVLGEYGVFNYRHLVHLPKHMSWEEVRTS